MKARLDERAHGMPAMNRQHERLLRDSETIVENKLICVNFALVVRGVGDYLRYVEQWYDPDSGQLLFEKDPLVEEEEVDVEDLDELEELDAEEF